MFPRACFLTLRPSMLPFSKIAAGHGLRCCKLQPWDPPRRTGFYISTESIFKPFLTFILRTFLSSTCSLSLSRPYLDLDGVNHPIWPARFRKPTRPRLCLPSHSTLASFHVLGSKPSLTAADHTHWAWCLTMKKRCKTGRNELRQSLKKAHSRPAFAFWLQYNQNENQNALAFWLAFWLQNVDTASQRR